MHSEKDLGKANYELLQHIRLLPGSCVARSKGIVRITLPVQGLREVVWRADRMGTALDCQEGPGHWWCFSTNGTCHGRAFVSDALVLEKKPRVMDWTITWTFKRSR